MSLKVAVVGGGSSYTPELLEGLLREHGRLPVTEVHLLDIPDGREKVEIVAALGRRMAEAQGRGVRIEWTLDAEKALDGANFVVSQFRAGLLQGRQRDEHLPLRYGMLGQETTGAGGFAYALRSVHASLELAERMRRLCPNAWLVNFTNPSGIVTEALLKHGFPRTVGLCNVAIGVEKATARHLGVNESRITLEAMGLNHLTWMRVFLDGQDLTPKVLHLDDGDLAAGRPANLPKPDWSPSLLRALGLLPNGYLHYYYEYEAAVRHELEAVERGEGTRADRVIEIERELFRLYADPSLREKPALLSKRGGAFYSEAAVRLMVGLYAGSPSPQVLNVRNAGTFAELPPDSVVEVACEVSPEGVRPIPPGAMPPMVRGLVQGVKAYEELTVEAARSGSRDLALAALLAHPLVRSAEKAERLLGDILREHADYLPRFRSGAAR